MELDDLVAINGLRGIVPAENAASPAYAVPTLIGRLLWHGDELDTRELAALGDRERPLDGPLTVEQKHLRELAIPEISQLDLAAIEFRRPDDEVGQPLWAQRMRHVGRRPEHNP